MRSSMILYSLRRLAAGVVIFFTVTAVTFVLYFGRGGNAIAMNFIPRDQWTPETIALKARQLGVDRPLLVQYGEWVSGLFRGDLGRSFGSSSTVNDMLANRIPVTLSLVIVSLLLMTILGVVLGVIAATRGGVFDRVLQSLSVVIGAVPGYWLALILVIVFSLNLKLTPATGFIPITESIPGWFSTIILPSIAISLAGIFGLAVWVRSSIIDMQRQDWVRTLRSHGLSERAIMYRHVLRNAAAPTVQILGLNIIGLMGGAIIVERIYALNGLGMMSVNSGQAGDIPVVLGAVTVMVTVIVVVNLVVDLVNGFLSPKARIA